LSLHLIWTLRGTGEDRWRTVGRANQQLRLARNAMERSEASENPVGKPCRRTDQCYSRKPLPGSRDCAVRPMVFTILLDVARFWRAYGNEACP